MRGYHDTSSGDDAINLIGDDASGDGFDDTHGFLPGAVTWARTKHQVRKRQWVIPTCDSILAVVPFKTRVFFRGSQKN